MSTPYRLTWSAHLVDSPLDILFFFNTRILPFFIVFLLSFFLSRDQAQDAEALQWEIQQSALGYF